jgi:hypothetical protein
MDVLDKNLGEMGSKDKALKRAKQSWLQIWLGWNARRVGQKLLFGSLLTYVG